MIYLKAYSILDRTMETGIFAECF